MATAFEDRFRGPGLDPGTWLPHYLPAWSSREATRASLRVDDSGLTLNTHLVPELVVAHIGGG